MAVFTFFKNLFQPRPSAHSTTLLDTDWRSTHWTKRDEMFEDVRSLELSNKAILHILALGPVGVGKSAFINSIDSIFMGRMTCGAISDEKSEDSFTKMYQTHRIKNGRHGEYLPFVISDTMGMEESYDKGLSPNDATAALEGHIKEGYKFDPEQPAEKVECTNLDDKIHCLVMVLQANTLTMVPDQVFKKMRNIRKKATELKIPQVTLLTKIDEACPDVKKDIKMVYRSKKIKEKMDECHHRLGVNLSHIFPVKNYHEETELNCDMDVLLLSALTHILNFANDHVAEIPPTEEED